MRSVSEMTAVAMKIRRGLLQDNLDPETGEFELTDDEYSLLKMEPMIKTSVHYEYARLCGLKLRIVPMKDV